MTTSPARIPSLPGLAERLARTAQAAEQVPTGTAAVVQLTQTRNCLHTARAVTVLPGAGGRAPRSLDIC
jgi:hypothetical protein